MVPVLFFLALIAAANGGELFGITMNPQPALSLIDPVNGTFTQIGGALLGQPLVLVSTLDPTNRTYYYVDTSSHPIANLTGLSLATGAVVSSVPLPVVIKDATTYGGMVIAYAANLDESVIVAGDLEDNTHVVGLLNPRTGAWRVVASISPQDESDETGSGVYIPSLQLFVFDLIVYTPHGWRTNFAVNMTSGAFVNRTNPVSQGSQIQQRLLNPQDNQLYGIGEVDPDDDHPGAPWNRTVERMDPLTLEVSVVGDVPEGWAVALAAGAIGHNSLFWLGTQGTNVNSTTEFFLVQNSLTDASVVSTSAIPMCSARGFPPPCPFSMQYLPS